jgi:hypothetical protein
MGPEQVLQAAIDVYHEHDLDKSIAENPNIHYEIPNRIALGTSANEST